MQKLIKLQYFSEKIFEGFLKMVGSMKFLSVLFLVGLHFYSNFAFGASESKIDDDEAPAAITSPAALEPKILYSSDEDFRIAITSILESAQYQRNLAGGSGGVHLFEGSGQKFLVKCSKDFPHMREEIMADVLYNALSVPVPKFFVVNTLPQTESFQKLNAFCPQGLYRISEFIEQDAALLPDFKSRVSEHFLVDAFLANRDIAGNSSNVMARGGVLYRIDNGGALRYRSIGGKKGMGGDSPWASTLIPEVETLPQGDGQFYDALTFDAFPLQAGRILEQAPRLFGEFKRAADGIEMPFRDQQDLQTMLVERLKVIEMYFAGNETFHASKKMHVAPSMAGGTFIIKKGNTATTDEAASSGDDQYYVLLGQAKSNNKWITLEGVADSVKDFDIAHAVSGKLYQASNGLINISDTVLSAQNSHDLVRWNQRFRQYFLLGGDIPEIKLNASLRSASSSSEYYEFKWVPLEALIDPTTLANGFFDWSSERFELFGPFRDLLQTEMVQENLRKLIAKDKLPEDQHTQSIPQGFVDGDLSKLKIYRFPFEHDIPLPQPLHEQELADQVFKKAEVLGELKSEREQVHLPGLSLSHYGSNIFSPRNPYPFTASEGFLKLFLGKDYIPVISPDLDDVYMRNLQAFFNKRPAGFIEMPDSSFLNTLVQVLKKERAMDPHFQVFYHGTQGDIGYLYDIFTEFRQLLKGDFADNVVVMRSVDEAFKDINNVQDFIGKFAGKSNYTGNYQDMGLSANVYLFGNPYRDTSSTLAYFYTNYSQRPIDVSKFFDFLNTTLLGLNLQKDRYWRLFQSIMGINPSMDSYLYQIFIQEDYVDSLVYAAGSGGYQHSISYDVLQPDLDRYDLSTSILMDCSTGERIQIAKAPTMMNSVLDILKKRPDLFEKGLSGVARGGSKAAEDLQARLFMKPQCMQRPRVSQTFIYHKNPSIDQDKTYALKMQLRNYLREDLSRWFQAKYEPDSDIFHPGSLLAMKHFKSQYERTFDQPFIVEKDNLNQKLVKIYETGDVELFKQLLKSHTAEELLATELMTADSYRDRLSLAKKLILNTEFMNRLSFLAETDSELQEKLSNAITFNVLSGSDPEFSKRFFISQKPGTQLFDMLLRKGVYVPKYQFSDRSTFLHKAVESQNLELTSWLLDRGEDINALNNILLSPVLIALNNKLNEISKLLLKRGAILPVLPGRTIGDFIHYDDAELIDLLIQRGLNVNQKLNNGLYPLQKAIQSHNLDAIIFLLQKGADPYRSNLLSLLSSLSLDEQKMILITAFGGGYDIGLFENSTNRLQFISILRDNPEIEKRFDNILSFYRDLLMQDKQNFYDWDSLKIIFQWEGFREPLLKFFAEKVAGEPEKSKREAFGQNIRYFPDWDNKGFAKALLENIKTSSYSQLQIQEFLEFIGSWVYVPWQSYFLRPDNFDLFQELISIEGVFDPAYVFLNGSTWLHNAVLAKNADIIPWLLSQGILIDAKANGFTALDYCFVTQQGIMPDMAKILVESGADVNTLNIQGMSPLSYAYSIKDYSLLDFMLKHGGRMDSTMSIYGQTLMSAILSAQDLDGMKVLIENGLIPSFGTDLLREAFSINNNEPMIQLLLSSGAVLPETGKYGEPLLEFAINASNWDLVKLVIERISNPDQELRYGSTALSLLTQNRNRIPNYVELADILIRKGATLYGPNIMQGILDTTVVSPGTASEWIQLAFKGVYDMTQFVRDYDRKAFLGWLTSIGVSFEDQTLESLAADPLKLYKEGILSYVTQLSINPSMIRELLLRSPIQRVSSEPDRISLFDWVSENETDPSEIKRQIWDDFLKETMFIFQGYNIRFILNNYPTELVLPLLIKTFGDNPTLGFTNDEDRKQFFDWALKNRNTELEMALFKSWIDFPWPMNQAGVMKYVLQAYNKPDLLTLFRKMFEVNSAFSFMDSDDQAAFKEWLAANPDHSLRVPESLVGGK